MSKCIPCSREHNLWSEYDTKFCADCIVKIRSVFEHPEDLAKRVKGISAIRGPGW